MRRTYSLVPFSPRSDARAANLRRRDRQPEFMLAGMVIASNQSAPIECAVRDRSISGARLELDRSIMGPAGTPRSLPSKITLVICREQTEIDCRVVWRDGRHMGVQFLTRPRPARTKLT